jgi:hypothetical protein
MEKYPKWIVEDLVRVASEALDKAGNPKPLVERFEAALIALDAEGVDKSFHKCFRLN